MYGRKVKGSIDSPKWIESYTMPGQFIAVRFPGEGEGAATTANSRVADKLYSLASSPYESRRDSAYFDASIIEVWMARSGCTSACTA